ncbi:unnamed protein product [Brassica rapa subsp. trilocularis]
MGSTSRKTPRHDFPRRVFAVGEEPVGIRVTPYHKPSCISKIINALEDYEIAVIKASPFGKLLNITEKPYSQAGLGVSLFRGN